MNKTTTIGMDLGDKSHQVCVLDPQGNITLEGRINNTNRAIDTFFDAHKGTVVAMEAGTHSPWISRRLAAMGHRVLVGNPRRLRPHPPRQRSAIATTDTSNYNAEQY